MTLTWATVPLLPLRCILDHLSTEDALAAMSTCSHWRNAFLHYEGRKETLKLRAKHLEKNMLLTRIFKRHTRKLHIYIDSNETELEKFINFVLPQFFDSVKLEELIFIGPSYLQKTTHTLAPIKLKRIITESLIFKNLHCIQKLALLGCGMSTVKNENERYYHKQVEFHSRSLNFNSISSPADSILSSTNYPQMQFSTLHQIIVDYDQINTLSLDTLSSLSNFRHLTLNLTKRVGSLQPVEWELLQLSYKHVLQVTVNIIEVPLSRFKAIMENVLVDGMTLVSLKVMFCKTLYAPLLSHVCHLYNSSLVELVWTDAPCNSTAATQRIVRPMSRPQPDLRNVNPFVLLCWQCTHLRRLVIHGYWVWQYDVLGFVRLRKTLESLEISSIYNKQSRFYSALQLSEEVSVRVLCGDTPPAVDKEFVREVNTLTEFNWKPTLWSKLPAGLRARSTALQRADYILNEATKPTPITLY